jgi:hypothetical protein
LGFLRGRGMVSPRGNGPYNRQVLCKVPSQGIIPKKLSAMQSVKNLQETLRLHKFVTISTATRLTSLCFIQINKADNPSVAYQGGGVQTPPHQKFQNFAKAEPNSQHRGIYIRNNVIRIRVSFIFKMSETLD